MTKEQSLWNQITEYLFQQHAGWTAGLLFSAMGIVIFVLLVIWISTELRLRRAVRTETIIDHRHSTPKTVDLIITNPLKMKSYHGTFFDPSEMHLTHGKDHEEFDIEYVGRMGNNYKYRIYKLEPKTVYTNVKIRMGQSTFMKQPVVNIWTRDEDDKIISIKEAIPYDKTIDKVTVKSDNCIQRRVNEQYFKYALHYGNSKTRWIDVKEKIVAKTTKKIEKENAVAKKTPAKKATTTKKATTAKKTTTKKSSK